MHVCMEVGCVYNVCMYLCQGLAGIGLVKWKLYIQLTSFLNTRKTSLFVLALTRGTWIDLNLICWSCAAKAVSIDQLSYWFMFMTYGSGGYPGLEMLTTNNFCLGNLLSATNLVMHPPPILRAPALNDLLFNVYWLFTPTYKSMQVSHQKNLHREGWRRGEWVGGKTRQPYDKRFFLNSGPVKFSIFPS